MMIADTDFITNLHATDPDTVTAALAQASQWVAETDLLAQPEQVHALLTGLKAVIEQQEMLNESLRAEAAEVMVRIFFGDRYELRDRPFFADIIAWYDDQMNYDDVVIHKAIERWHDAIKTRQAPYLTELRSGDAARIRKTLVEVDDYLTYNSNIGTPVLFGPIVLALKEILDNDTHLDPAVLAEVRALLMEQMWLNRYLIGDYSSELVALLEWYLDTDEYKSRSRLQRDISSPTET